VGARYTQSFYSYRVNGLLLPPNYWGERPTYELPDESGNSGFASLVGGIHVTIFPRWAMGWSLRYDTRIYHSASENSRPPVIPGIGAYRGSDLVNLCYHLYYRF
jgi:hypothetical protein